MLPGLKSIARCTKLRLLKIGYCMDITDAGLVHIGATCKNLREFDSYRFVSMSDPIFPFHCCMPICKVLTHTFNFGLFPALLPRIPWVETNSNLDIGIWMLGSWWASHELGSGSWWFWDPLYLVNTMECDMSVL